MAETSDLNTEISVENVPSVEREVQVITEFNAPNDYTDPETLQKFYSGVSEGDNRSAYSFFGQFNAGLGKTRQSEMSGSRDEVTSGKKSSAMSRDVNSAGNMADPVFQNPMTGNMFYQQQLLQTQSMFIEQQKMLNKLSASMEAMKKAGDKRKRSDSRQSAAVMEDSNGEITSDSDNNESGECSGSEEEDLDGPKRFKVSETLSERKKEKLKTVEKTAKELKDSDKQMQRTQLYLTKGMMPLVQIMSKTFEAESEESEEIFDMALDAFSLLAYSHRDLSTQRKRMLKPAISTKYKALCGDDTSITANQLFGENLSEQIKKIDETGKISNKLSKWKNKNYYKSDRKEGDYSKSGGQNFRYSGKGQFGQKQNSFLSKKGPRSHQKSYKKGGPGRHQK